MSIPRESAERALADAGRPVSNPDWSAARASVGLAWAMLDLADAIRDHTADQRARNGGAAALPPMETKGG